LEVRGGDRFCPSCGAPSPGAPSTPPDSDLSADQTNTWRVLARLRDVTVGEYDILGELGRGGMSVVYLAHDLHLDRKVAIKVMLPGLRFWGGMDARFKFEARTAAQLDHPNIVVIHDVREVDELLYFVMKYIDGPTLDSVLQHTGPLPLPVAQTIIAHVADGLQYAHTAGVIHRDVKPANIMLDARGTPIVTDFGTAKAAANAELTRSGAMVGTPAYMSPEQCLGHPTTVASDQYSLGVLAYELLTGRPPFTGATLEIQWAHARQQPEPIRTLRPDCPPALDEAVMRMLAKDPAARWPSVAAAIPWLAEGIREGDPALREELLALARSVPIAQPAVVAPSTTETAPASEAATPAPAPREKLPPKPVPPTVAFSSRRLLAGETFDLPVPAGGPADGSSTAPIIWQSSAPDVATVSPAGRVSAVRQGIAFITATDADHRELARWHVSVVAMQMRAELRPFVADAGGPLMVGEAPPSSLSGRAAVVAIAAVLVAALALAAWQRRSGSSRADQLAASVLPADTSVSNKRLSFDTAAGSTQRKPAAESAASAPTPPAAASVVQPDTTSGPTTTPKPMTARERAREAQRIRDAARQVQRDAARKEAARAETARAAPPPVTRPAPAVVTRPGPDLSRPAAETSNARSVARAPLGKPATDSARDTTATPAKPPEQRPAPVTTPSREQTPPAPTPSAPAPTAPSSEAVANALRLPVGDFVLLMRNRDYGSVARAYAPGAAGAGRRADFLRFLNDFQPGATLRGLPEVRDVTADDASFEFSVVFRWRSNVGVSRDRTGTFIAHAVRRADGWRIDRMDVASLFWK
jgi:serine/threonine protein kinase